MSETIESGNLEPGDPFEAIVLRYHEPLYRFAISLTQSRADACDLVQQTFYVWATKGHQLRDLSKVKTWLFTTLHRDFLNGRRRRDRFVHENIEEFREQLPGPDVKPGEAVDSSQVLTALAGVDRIYQSAVALFYLEDCSYKEIAAILDVRIGTVKSRIARGIVQLRKILKLHETPDSSANHAGISPITRKEEQSISPENAPAQDSDRERTAAQHVGADYDEWDLSSTYLPEQSGLI